MCLIFTILFAFAIGYFVKSKLLGVVSYLSLIALVFSFQTLKLLFEWMAGSGEAFGRPPTKFPVAYDQSSVIGYGLVNAVIITVGTGLVLLGVWTARRRSSKTGVSLA